MFHRIVHANDGTTNAFTALRTAIDLAKLARATLDVIFVEEISPRSGLIGEVAAHEADERRHIRQRRAAAERMAERHQVKVESHVFTGHPGQHIVQFTAETDADLLVIGATEHADLWERIFGRRSDRMTHKVGCSVLIVREGGRDAA
ncbi:MAG: universal stress protein [Sphingomonadaceae bacterium]|nr:universal stress protein [Sphingomonadaceae bacterium]